MDDADGDGRMPALHGPKSVQRILECVAVDDRLEAVCTLKLRHVAPFRRMQGIIFRGADKLPEWSAECAHSNRGAFLQSHQYRRCDILLIERFRVCQRKGGCSFDFIALPQKIRE